MLQIQLADLNIALDFPSRLIHDRFKLYKSSFTRPDLVLQISFNEVPELLQSMKFGLFGIHAKYHIDESGYYHLKFIDKTFIPQYIMASANWSEISLIIDPGSIINMTAENIRLIQNNLFQCVREVLIPALLMRNGVLIHSASIVYNNKGVVFSAPSGTGKSTHVGLWKDKYDIQVLNGDVTGCRTAAAKPYIYGLPWCGTSGVFLNMRLPLHAIFFIEQHESNRITRLDYAEAAIRLFSRCFAYLSDETVPDLLLATVNKMVGLTKCYLLECRPDYEAVELVKECLDSI